MIYVLEFETRTHFIKDTFSYFDNIKKKEIINLHKGTVYIRQHTASQPIDVDSWEELLERYYNKTNLNRRQDFGRIESNDMFNLDRNKLFDVLYKELGK